MKYYGFFLAASYKVSVTDGKGSRDETCPSTYMMESKYSESTEKGSDDCIDLKDHRVDTLKTELLFCHNLVVLRITDMS